MSLNNMIDISLPISESQVVPVESIVPRKRREFLEPIENEPGNYLLVMDNTAVEQLVRCPTAGLYFLIHGRQAHAKNAALTFGGAVHEGLEGLFKGKDRGEQDMAMVQYFADNPTAPDEYRTPTTALQVLQHYREQKRVRVDYEEEILSDEHGLIIERAFELPLGVLEINKPIKLPKWNEPRIINQIHVAWAGRIDRLSYTFQCNRVVDAKTTSMAGDQFIQGFQLANQTIGYVWAAQQLWPDLDISGFCLDAIHLKKPSGRVGLMEKGVRGGEPALNFFRAYFDYTQQRIDQWIGNVFTIIEDFIHCLVRDNFPMHTFHCFNKYGKCQYHDVCTMDDPGVRVRFLYSDTYRDVTWDPTLGR